MKLRNILLLLLSVIVVASLTACDKESHNGRLDGMWQLMEVAAFQPDGSTLTTDVSPNHTYLSFQLDLAQIRPGSTPIDLRGAGTVVCRFEHRGAMLRFYNFYRHFRSADSLFTDADTTLLSPICITGHEARFNVDCLTSNRLELTGRNGRLRFRKF